jgi:hypothetical protein
MARFIHSELKRVHFTSIERGGSIPRCDRDNTGGAAQGRTRDPTAGHGPAESKRALHPC